MTIDCAGEGVISTTGIGGIVLQGNIEIDTLVCQGAVGFGEQYEITDCDGSHILELDGKPAATVIVERLHQGRRRHTEG